MCNCNNMLCFTQQIIKKGIDNYGNDNWLFILLYVICCGYYWFCIVRETNCRYYALVRKELISMKYEVEVTSRTVYVVEADSYEEARELVINDCGSIRIADEVEDIDVRKLV